jgi:class 3 adenylate cyclase/predicted ATPase
MDVGVWLRSLGLGRYEVAFSENSIDADVLPDLTDSDLEKLGVTLGHRKRLLKAIAALGTAEVTAKPSSPAPASSPAGVAERRPITVMFCDLVGSTSLAAKLDAEDWRDLVGAYLDAASAAVTGLGGHVLKKLGDGLMALFGYPHAQENDAERAVRAALAIQRALVEINARNASKGVPELSARIGLDSGQVVVDATGEVFGDAPNIAARVQSAAGPGSILITATVQRQTAGLFVAEDRGQHELKGVSAPMTLYRVVRASGGGRRGGTRGLTPLVGREEELDLLGRRWERARQGEGQLALIIGEPGLGKSRLMEEFHGRLGETPHTWVEWSSSQLLQNTPLHPIAEWGRQRFGAELSAEQRLADLEHTLQLIGLDATEYAPLLAPLVDVPLPEDRVAKLAPEELRRRQLAAMTAWILAAARTQAVVFAFEDLHWADPTSLDLMRALAERGAQAPLLIIATARPEFRPPWSVRSHHSVISLSPLDRVQIAKMVIELSARHALPRDIVEGVTERTGGVPLFVEEVTRLLLERGEQGGAQAIPPTLQQSLAARLDRLGSARETAQIGAVLGRGFSYALLQSVAGLDEGALQSALERLAQADILFVEGDGAQATYRFKHALIQDAAYGSLLKSRRQPLHARAAEILRETASPEPEAIAHHLTEAGLDDLAIEWWGKAGDQALRRSAFQEAISHLGKAIAMADKTVRSPAEGSAIPNSRLTHLQVAYGNALIPVRGYGARESTEAFTKVRESTYGDDAWPERLAADYGLWVGSYVRGELSSMRTHAATFLRDVEARPDSPEASVAHRTGGITCWFAGEYQQARDHLERALALFHPGCDDDLAFRFGHDAGVGAMVYLAVATWPLGDVKRANSLVDGAQERLASVTHIGTHGYAKMHAAMYQLMRGDHGRLASNAFDLTRLVREYDLNAWGEHGVFLQGCAASYTGAPVDGLEDMRRGAKLLGERNLLYFDGLVKIELARAEHRAGDPDRAAAVLDEALATSERTGHRAFDAELHRARGEMLLKRDRINPAPAEDAFVTAIAIAQQQGARSFELRAALALAKLYQSTGRSAEAHAVLAPALEGFAPTPEMPEIAEAKAVLAALAETDEVKVEAAHRRRLTQLHVSYGNALQSARGYGAPETVQAFARARDLSDGSEDLLARIATLYGVWLGAVTKGGFEAGREAAEAMLAEATRMGDPAVTGVAHRALGATLLYGGGFEEAKRHLDSAVALLEPISDAELAQRSNGSPLAAARILRALAAWATLDPDRADSEASHAIAEAERIGDAASLSYYYGWKAIIEAERRNVEQAGEDARRVLAIAADKGLRSWVAAATLLDKWSRSPLGGGAFSAAMVHEARAALAEVGHDAILGPVFATLAAEWEAHAGRADEGLALVDEMLADIRRNGVRWHEAELRRVRGEALTLGIAADPTSAEAEFKAAIIIARDQGARSFELRASMSLAKFYQSMGRPTEAHAVLAPALEGFAPTSEFPEIGEAVSFMAAIKARPHL